MVTSVRPTVGFVALVLLGVGAALVLADAVGDLWEAPDLAGLLRLAVEGVVAAVLLSVLWRWTRQG